MIQIHTMSYHNKSVSEPQMVDRNVKSMVLQMGAHLDVPKVKYLRTGYLMEHTPGMLQDKHLVQLLH